MDNTVKLYYTVNIGNENKHSVGATTLHTQFML